MDIQEISIISLQGKNFIPFQASIGAAGYDLKSTQTKSIPSFHSIIIDTGIFVEIPHGIYGEIKGRSGLAFRDGIQVHNSSNMGADRSASCTEREYTLG